MGLLARRIYDIHFAGDGADGKICELGNLT